MPDIEANPTTESQRRMLRFVERWQDAYNIGASKMVLECYAPDAYVQFTGGEARGHEQFLKVENGVVEGCPGRYMRIDRALFSGDETAIVEAVVLDRDRADFYSPFCAILTIRDDRIVADRTYLDPGNWPGIDKAAEHITPGGIGSAN